MENNPVVKCIENGMEMGAVLAMILSYSVNKSIIWAIIHSILSWVYVIYFAITQ